MLFSGIPFLYYFLPCVLILYFAVPKKLKNSALLLSSLVFYGWGEPKFLILMVAAIIVGYVCGLLIEKYADRPASKVFMGVSVVFSILSLGIFKYADFFIENFNSLTGLSVPFLKLALPIGISFYTFQILSYTIDVYRKDVAAQKNIINLATYIAMFPQLIAGPIVRYSDVAEQLSERTHSLEKCAEGGRRFIFGLGKKVLIANQLGELCEIFLASGDKSVLFYWIYAISFSLHIYFDFSGYSDMAIGLGKIFGFDFCENFNYPYISKSVTEFWRRWHMSLSTWFRDYVYIPLGGNRVKPWRRFVNIFLVWMLTGFWHGAEWTFIVWGLYFAVFLIIEKLFLGKVLKKVPFVGHVYVLLAVVISFVIFNAQDLPTALEHIGGMFGFAGVPAVSPESIYYLKSFGVVILLALVGATPIVKKSALRIGDTKLGCKIYTVLEPAVLAVLLVVITAYLVDGAFNPFLYFRF